MSKITAYCFKKYSIAKDEEILAPRMATLEAIKQFQCVPLRIRVKKLIHLNFQITVNIRKHLQSFMQQGVSLSLILTLSES